MDTEQLEVDRRSELKKVKVKKLRSKNLIPAIVYGMGKENITISVNYPQFEKVLKGKLGKNVVLKLNVKDGKDSYDEQVISYKITQDALTRKITHVDFLRVSEDKEVEINVGIKFTGTAPGTKVGGTLIKKLDQLKISVKPNDIPEFIEVDLSNLNLGEFYRVSDLKSDTYSFVTNKMESIVRVSAPRGKEVDASEDELSEESSEPSSSDNSSSDTE